MPRPAILLVAFMSLAAPGLARAQALSGGDGLVYTGDAAFWISAPIGWVLDKDAGRNDGPLVVVYRFGESWASGDAVMYVNTVQAVDTGANPFARTVSADSVQWLRRAPDAVTRSVTSLRTDDGTRATVIEFASAAVPSYEAVAYVPAASEDVPVLVLTAHTRHAFERAWPAFELLVHSYAPARLTVRTASSR